MSMLILLKRFTTHFDEIRTLSNYVIFDTKLCEPDGRLFSYVE